MFYFYFIIYFIQGNLHNNSSIKSQWREENLLRNAFNFMFKVCRRTFYEYYQESYSNTLAKLFCSFPYASTEDEFKEIKRPGFYFFCASQPFFFQSSSFFLLRLQLLFFVLQVRFLFYSRGKKLKKKNRFNFFLCFTYVFSSPFSFLLTYLILFELLKRTET